MRCCWLTRGPESSRGRRRRLREWSYWLVSGPWAVCFDGAAGAGNDQHRFAAAPCVIELSQKLHWSLDSSPAIDLLHSEGMAMAKTKKESGDISASLEKAVRRGEKLERTLLRLIAQSEPMSAAEQLLKAVRKGMKQFREEIEAGSILTSQGAKKKPSVEVSASTSEEVATVRRARTRKAPAKSKRAKPSATAGEQRPTSRERKAV